MGKAIGNTGREANGDSAIGTMSGLRAVVAEKGVTWNTT